MSKAIVLLINNAIQARQVANQQEEKGIELLNEVCSEIHTKIFHQYTHRHGIVSVAVGPTKIHPDATEEVAVRVTITRPESSEGYLETALATIRGIDAVFAEYQMNNWSTDNVAGSPLTEIVYR